MIRLLLTLALVLPLTACSLFSYTSSRNTVEVVTYGLDEQGNMKPQEKTVVEGILSDGKANFEMLRLYQAEEGGTASIKVAEYVKVDRVDDSRTAGEVSLAKAQGSQDVAVKAGEAIVTGAVAYATAGAGTPVGLGAIPSILQALKGAKDATQTEAPTGADSTNPSDTPDASKPAEAAGTTNAGVRAHHKK